MLIQFWGLVKSILGRSALRAHRGLYKAHECKRPIVVTNEI
jgi:hypothetical protein